ncbi:MAG: hypothetical protein ACLSVD_00375 [Eggerthellaceae bacterium]
MVRGPVTMHTRNVSTIMAATVMTLRRADALLGGAPACAFGWSMVFSVLMLLSFAGPSGRAGGKSGARRKACRAAGVRADCFDSLS